MAISLKTAKNLARNATNLATSLKIARSAINAKSLATRPKIARNPIM
jgi:hypothetical protein